MAAPAPVPSLHSQMNSSYTVPGPSQSFQSFPSFTPSAANLATNYALPTRLGYNSFGVQTPIAMNANTNTPISSVELNSLAFPQLKATPFAGQAPTVNGHQFSSSMVYQPSRILVNPYSTERVVSYNVDMSTSTGPVRVSHNSHGPAGESIAQYATNQSTSKPFISLLPNGQQALIQPVSQLENHLKLAATPVSPAAAHFSHSRANTEMNRSIENQRILDYKVHRQQMMPEVKTDIIRWAKRFDQRYMTFFYVDLFTGMSQWDRPYDYMENEEQKARDAAAMQLAQQNQMMMMNQQQQQQNNGGESKESAYQTGGSSSGGDYNSQASNYQSQTNQPYRSQQQGGGNSQYHSQSNSRSSQPPPHQQPQRFNSNRQQSNANYQSNSNSNQYQSNSNNYQSNSNQNNYQQNNALPPPIPRQANYNSQANYQSQSHSSHSQYNSQSNSNSSNSRSMPPRRPSFTPQVAQPGISILPSAYESNRPQIPDAPAFGDDAGDASAYYSVPNAPDMNAPMAPPMAPPFSPPAAPPMSMPIPSKHRSSLSSPGFDDNSNGGGSQYEFVEEYGGQNNAPPPMDNNQYEQQNSNSNQNQNYQQYNNSQPGFSEAPPAEASYSSTASVREPDALSAQLTAGLSKLKKPRGSVAQSSRRQSRAQAQQGPRLSMALKTGLGIIRAGVEEEDEPQEDVDDWDT